MTNDQNRTTRKGRLPATFLVVAASLITVAAMAGVGFAQGSSSVAQYQYGQKVTICHQTHSKKHPHVTITVAQAAVKAHLRHGDSLGACAAQAPSSTGGSKPKHGNSGKDANPPAAAASTPSAGAGKSGDHPNHGHGK